MLNNGKIRCLGVTKGISSPSNIDGAEVQHSQSISSKHYELDEKRKRRKTVKERRRFIVMVTKCCQVTVSYRHCRRRENSQTFVRSSASRRVDLQFSELDPSVCVEEMDGILKLTKHVDNPRGYALMTARAEEFKYWKSCFESESFRVL